MAIVSRLNLNHPALGTAGGASLHTSIEALYTKIGDAINTRWFSLADFDQTEVVDLDHNFGTDILNISFDLWNWNGTEWVLLDETTTPLRSAFSIIEKVGFTSTVLQITNNTGGDNLTFAVSMRMNDTYLQQGDIRDVDTTGIADGQTLSYESSSKKFKKSQDIYIGNSTKNASAVAQFDSTTKGMLIPRMTTAQRDAISTPATGLLVFNTDTNQLNYYNGSSWSVPLINPMTGQSDIIIGSISGTPSRLPPNMLGRSTVEYTESTVSISNQNPCVVTYNSHGRVTGDTCYFKTTGSLPSGVSANTRYWINRIDANTFNLADSLAGLIAGTYVATTSNGSGVHTGHFGGIGSKEFRQASVSGNSPNQGENGETLTSTITSTNLTTTSETDITGASLDLKIGRWLIVYNLSCYYITGSNSGDNGYVQTRITDSSNVLLSGSLKVLEAKTVASISNIISSSLNHSQVVNLSQNKTYKLRATRGDVAGTGSAAVQNSGLYNSNFYAIRLP